MRNRTNVFNPVPALFVAALALVLVACVGSVGMRATRLSDHRDSFEEMKRNSPSRSLDGGYVSSDACKACHPGEHASWHRTYHRTMTQGILAVPIGGGFLFVAVLLTAVAIEWSVSSRISGDADSN